MPKSKLRIKKATFAPKTGKHCPVDGDTLIYVPDHLMWECPQKVNGCAYKEYPEAETHIPVSAKGKCGIVVTADEDGDQTFLLQFENNVFIPLDRSQIQFSDTDHPIVMIHTDWLRKV